MQRGKELYQALLHSPPPINPGEWKHKGLILRLANFPTFTRKLHPYQFEAFLENTSYIVWIV
jgi:hypothetical protein